MFILGPIAEADVGFDVYGSRPHTCRCRMLWTHRSDGRN